MGHLGMNLSRNGLIVLISVIFVAGAGTAYAGIVLPTITLAGDVVITGDLTCTDCIDGPDTHPGLFYKKTATGLSTFFLNSPIHMSFYRLSCNAGDVLMDGSAVMPATPGVVGSVLNNLGGKADSIDTYEHAIELLDITPADMLAPSIFQPPHPVTLEITCWNKTVP